MTSRQGNIIKTEALVLKKRELLEKDILLTLFTQELGKVTITAKGVRKITSRRASHIETLNLIKVLLYRKTERLYLQGTELISAFSAIKKDARKVNDVYKFLFILDRILPEQQPEPAVYAIAKQFLISVSRADIFSEIHLAEYMKEVLRALGFGTNAVTFADLIREIEEIIQEKMPENVII